MDHMGRIKIISVLLYIVETGIICPHFGEIMTSGKHTLTPIVILRFQFIKPDYGGFLALNISAYEGRSRISNRFHIGNIFAPPSPWISMLLQTPAKYHGRRSEREYINCSRSSKYPIGGIIGGTLA